jgi:hypothetical protein
VDGSNEAGLRMQRAPADYQKLAFLSERARDRLRQADEGKLFGKGLGALIVDVDLDGKPDIYVANDGVEKFFYRNRSVAGKIQLEDAGLDTGLALDGAGMPNGSMGLDAGDPEGTGLPSLWVTNFENELHGLYRNVSTRDRLLFVFHTQAAGIAAIGQKYVGWGTGFVDIDHHGWEDLVIIHGHVIRFPQNAPRLQKPLLLRNQAGKFTDLSGRGGSYFQKPHLGRGLALGDLDNDGKVDMVISHVNEPVAILRNVSGSGNHWLGVGLAGADHADVVGARIILEAGGRKQTRFAKGGGSYASSPDRRHVFGLGATDRIDRLSVLWPNGQEQRWTGLRSDRYYALTQGQNEAREIRRSSE